MAIIVINPYQYAAPIGPSADPYSDYVSLLLHGNGTNGSTTFTDSSSYGHTVTPAGDAQISTTQSKFGGASMYFDGSRNPTDYLILPNEANLALLNDDFTVEMWCYLNEYDNELFFWNCNSSAFGGVRIINTSDGTIYLLASTNGTSHTTALGSTATLQLNTWHHIALTKNGSTARVFVDGVIVITTTISSSINNGGINNIGGRSAYPDSMNGYIDDLRITKGVARYTSNFNPPTAELPDPSDPDFDSVSLLLHGDGTNGSTTFIDSSSNSHTVTPAGNAQISTTQSKFGGASMYFDGSGDTLTIPGSPEFSFDGDFTVEFWCYPTNTSTNNQYFIEIGGYSNGLIIRYRSNTYSDDIYVQGTNPIYITPEINANQWNHIALTRSGSTVRAFVDGVVDTQTLTVSGTVNTANAGITIGRGGFANSYEGYIDDLRITKGVARYTANFTPPTAPLPDETPPIVTDGLVLHLDAGDSTSYPGTGTTWFDLTTNNNDGTISGATYSSANGGYLSFDGNDYVSCGNPSPLQITQGTISAWVKTSSPGSAYRGIIAKPNNYGLFAKNGYLIAYDWGNGVDRATSINIADGNWKNVVMSFTENTGTPSNNAIIYLNGSSVLTTTIKSVNNSINLEIGSGVGGQYINGNIAQVTIYNRPLTQSEVTQNFDALKKRYGL